MFDFQKHVSKVAIKKGRCAVFLDTGLGKTIIELTTAVNYLRHTNKPVLIITPLAVAFQFIKEAEKFGIDDISYSKDGKYKTKIVVCNYERLEHFTASDFDCVILDESSILKNFEGAIKSQVTTFLKKVKYRFLFTATPSPNDYIELGTSSEALGYLGYTDMLQKFFKNNNNNTVKIGRIASARQGVEWYLKPHAERDFWRWIASWSLSMRKPSDLGFDDSRHILPELIERSTMVTNINPLCVNGQHLMFNSVAQSFAEVKAEVRATIHERCEAAVIKASEHDISVYWVNLNDEADLISQLDKNTVEVKGKMDIDEKEEILLSFSKGEIKKLITKTSITAFGLNWQHCNHTTYFPTYSYEQYYQAIRRFWRFGQKRKVIVDLILSDGQTRIMESLMIKKDKAISMFENLTQQTNSDFTINKKEFDKQINLPKFITA
jgi:superfamily II DNA or RNA helicase